MVLKQQDSYKTELGDSLYTQLQEFRNKSQKIHAQLNNDTIKNEYSLIKEMNETNDSIFQIISKVNRKNITIVQLDKILSRLSNKTILTYIFQDDVQYALVINNGIINYHNLELTSSDLDTISKFRSYILTKPTLETNKLSKRVYQLLIGNLQDSLKEEVIIIPDGKISDIPFEVLIDSNNRMLIYNHFISYAYSLSVLEEMDYKDINANKFLAFAPSYYGNSEELPMAPKEIMGIQDKFDKPKVFLDDNASKENFIKWANDFNIIHIAAHADVNNFNGDYSYIEFSNKSNNENSTHLYLHNLYYMNLNAKMIVLSACNTGIGKHASGEGVLSIARGFIHAGTASIVSTLWPVGDKSSKYIMTSFYNHLADGKQKDIALTLAKRDFLNRDSIVSDADIRQWAGFILIGDSSPIFDRPYCLWCWFIGFLLIIFFFFLYSRMEAY